MKRPVFPPNRVIREGEPCCTRCGSGRSTHEDGSRDHLFQPKPSTVGDLLLTVLVSILAIVCLAAIGLVALAVILTRP